MSLPPALAEPPATGTAPRDLSPGGRAGDRIVVALDRAGYRLTEPRRAVAELVAGRAGHFTAADLVADAHRRHVAIGRATIFRTLDVFATLGLVERVDLPGGEHAYVACDPVHHHHAICTSCGGSLDITDHGLADILGEIGRRSGFHVTAHRLELFGLCATCGAAAPAD
jgi:Fe2+ or Zn2+ uptake regulation protein